MSSAASSPQHLRLVGVDDPDVLDIWTNQRPARQSVIRENRLSAGNIQLEPTDPRWVLAVKTHTHLQGSTLTPERRQRLLSIASKIGLRPFEANLIMAVVQDHARRGEHLDAALPALVMIESPKASNPSAGWWRWIAALCCAILANVFLIWWLTSA